MEYISIPLFLTLFSKEREQELHDDFSELYARLLVMGQDEIDRKLGNGQSRSKEELIRTYASFQQAETLIFYQWIDHNKAIKNLLEHGQLSVNGSSSEPVKGHFLYERFSNFVSPLLLGKLLVCAEENKAQQKIASYLSVLNDDSCLVLQEKLNSVRKTSWEKLERSLPEHKTENELGKALSDYFSDEQIRALNHYNKAFYATKIAFIDQGISLFKHPEATHRLVYWLIHQLQKLELNPDHKLHLREVHDSIKRGDSEYFRRKEGIRSSWTIGRIAGILFLVLIFTAGFYLLKTNQELFGEEPEDKSASSFQDFTKKERMQLDSLIRSMEHKTENEEPIMDQGTSYLHLAPVELDLIERNPLRNKKMESYIQDVSKANAIVLEGNNDSCVPYTRKQLDQLNFPGFEKLAKNQGDKTLFLKNEAEYQVLVLVFDDFESGKVYAGLILADKELKIKMNPGQKLILLPGTNLGKFYCSKKGLDLPAKDYLHHFCFTDENLEVQLYTHYTLKEEDRETIKVLINQTDEGQFYLVDLYEALEQE